MQPFRERESILDGQPHIGNPQLRLHTTVTELHRTVDDRLRMDEYLYLIGRYTEEPLRLYHLKALVHQRCGVDGDLGPHVPCRML